MYIAIFDIDGVIYKGHIIFDIIQNQEKKGLIPQGTWNQIHNLLLKYKSKKLDYTTTANLMLKIYIASLKENKYQTIKAHLNNYYQQHKYLFYPYFKKILPILQNTHDIYLVTTNLKVTAETLSEKFKLTGFLSTEEEIINDKYTGKIIRSLAGNKHLVEKIIDKYPHQYSIGVGDSINDISMLEKVANPICMNPDEGLLAKAQAENWLIANSDNITEKITKIINSKI